MVAVCARIGSVGWSYLLLVVVALATQGCKWVRVEVSPERQRQGDELVIEVDAGEPENLDHVTVRVNGVETTVTSVPHTISMPTCKKTTGEYLTAVTISAEAVYDSGKTRTTGPDTYDLTWASKAREDTSRTFSVYIADDPSSKRKVIEMEMAEKFIDEFDTYSLDHYYFSRLTHYTTDAASKVDSSDLTISIGHGNRHVYVVGTPMKIGLDLSSTAFGGLAHCDAAGDAEYLVFASCRTLSMADVGGRPFWWYWFNDHGTRLVKRPFSGLHQVAGFRTDFGVRSWYWLGWHSTGRALFDEFAKNLDSGRRFKNSWLDAVGDELSFLHNRNRGAVIYHELYMHDDLASDKSDFIFGNPNYARQWIEYWE